MRTPFLLLCFIHLFFQEHEFSVLNLFQISRIADGIAVIVEADIPRYALIIHLRSTLVSTSFVPSRLSSAVTIVI